MFPETLKKLRMQKKYSQQYMADLLGVTRQAYSKYETGEAQPGHEGLLKIAKKFDVSVDYLLGNDETHNSLSEEDRKILDFANSVEGEWYSKLPETDQEVIEHFRSLYYMLEKNKKN
ncbi:helix-turn-helix domain-containing protein [Jeotgalibacillus proteolyticus]|uniref:XRE family transcriptional regulator n=1 Tax=Jeotgalibacillus proteolyticus TaxID=2082395 RepID=A0A2S5GAR4_9BACL|nr:helix-turn-helix domain-containing protein [Jeotgalibacillus proteolyticus]PPA70080.1 XRE family transcriptional regulator [Jeotgalibacillus proteolyticus]